MSLHEHVGPGIYIDEHNGDIWRKTPRGPWEVNGTVWTPFPNTLTTLTTTVTVAKTWKTIPNYPKYEVDESGLVRNRETKELEKLCCLKPEHAFYWLKDIYSHGHWVRKDSI